MVVIDDFRKQILYERLNLGYDCTFCKKRFYSKREQLQHLQDVHLNRRKKEQFECPKCRKRFGHSQIYQLHLQIHALSEPDSKNLPDSKDVNGPTTSNSKTITPSQSHQNKNKQKSTTTSPKKVIGLTKVRMEDCLRCDACSCIYIDRNDYYKHMRNFHKVSDIEPVPAPASTNPAPVLRSAPPESSSPVTTTIPKTTTTNPLPSKVASSSFSEKKKCRSCCRHCRDDTTGRELHRHFHKFHHANRLLQSRRSLSNELFRFSMQDNIKDRWSKMVSTRLLEPEPELEQEEKPELMKIKPDPDAMEMETSLKDTIINSDEMSHLLSQVEVKIKTEPLDER